MTYREKFRTLTDWKQKVLVLELYHLLMLSKNKNWKLAGTAKYFGISIALVSEDLKLSAELGSTHTLDDCESRNKALKLMRHQ